MTTVKKNVIQVSLVSPSGRALNACICALIEFET